LNPSPWKVSGTFNSLFKVLCNFPSRYLFAIGLWLIFSFRRNSPPTLHCTLKQYDSTNCSHMDKPLPTPTGLSPSMALCSNKLSAGRLTRAQSENYNSARGLPPPDSVLSFSLFTRSYWGNRGCFLFLRLLICLSSAGNPA